MGGFSARSEEATVLLDFSEDDNATVHFTLESWVTFVAVIIPDLDDDADVGIEVSDDGGSTYYPVLDIADGQDLIICDNSPSDPAYVDISDYIRAFMHDGCATPTRFRFTTSVAQSADKTFRIFKRG